MKIFSPLRIGLILLIAVASALFSWWLLHTYAKSNAPLSTDSIAHRLLQDGRAYDAALVFEDPLWKGVALFRAERFQRAAAAFSLIDTISGHYNLGVSYVYLKRYDEAESTFRTVLARDPGHEDARHNLRLLRDLKKKEEENERSGQAADQGSQRKRAEESASSGDEQQMSAPQLAQEEAESSDGKSKRDPGQVDSQNITDVRAGGTGSAQMRADLIEKLAEQAAGRTRNQEEPESEEHPDGTGSHDDREITRQKILADRIRLREIADRPDIVLRARLRAAALRQRPEK